MKIPIDIQNKMRQAAKLFNEAHELMKDIDLFFENKGISDDVYRSDNGISITEIEYGIDIVDDFVKWADSEL